MNIRNADVTDAAQLAELSEVLGYPVEPEIIKRRLERLLARPDHIVFVAEVSPTRVVGWIHAAEQDILEAGCSGEILGLMVAADRRREGIGRRLVEKVETWASARGLEQISVRSNVVRTESHPFYERMEYVRVKTQHAYRKCIR